jgi:hypothetical protein
MVTIFVYELFDLAQFAAVKAVVGGQLNWIEPVLGLISTGLDVNVWWFSPFIAEKEKAKPPNSQDGGHLTELLSASGMNFPYALACLSVSPRTLST